MICGSLAFNAPECLERGSYTQRSDSWAVALTMWELFMGHMPFSSHPRLAGVLGSSKKSADALASIIREEGVPQLDDTDLFLDLQDECEEVAKCLDEVYKGMTEFERKKRWTVRKAVKKVQEVKYLLPVFGKGYDVRAKIELERRIVYSSVPIMGGSSFDSDSRHE